MTTEPGSGIPTEYRNTVFRSRLEARWAALFDLLRWSWVYEPFDTPGWIPDFLIQGPHPFLVEIGPCASEAELHQKAAKARTYLERPTLVLGASPTILDRHWTYAGLLVNEQLGFADKAYWLVGPDMTAVSIFQDGEHRPDGSWGDRWHPTLDDARWLEELWARAGNITQWRPGPQSIGKIISGLAR